MELCLNQELQEFKEWIKRLADKEIAPWVTPEREAAGEFDKDNWHRLCREGLLGLVIPKQYGGLEKDYFHYVIAMEEISRANAALGTIYDVHCSLVLEILLRFCSDEHKRKYIPPLLSGEKMAAFCLTEPDAGSDAGAGRTKAVKQGDAYVINGHKHFIMNAQLADFYIVFAKTDPEAGAKGISAFIVERDNPGVKVGKDFDKMGIRTSYTGEVYFDDCEVSDDNLIGKEGIGFKIAMTALDYGRMGIGAQSVGVAQAALDESIAFAKQRVQFGKPIAQQQAIQWMIAEMWTEINGARLMTYQVADLATRNQRFSVEAAMAKLQASDVAVRCTRKALQIHGGYGFMKDFKVERLYRDAKIMEIYEGTSEIQKLIISGALLR